MGLKILHSADWHLDSPFAGFSPEQRTYLEAQQRKIPGKIGDLIRRENCDLVLLSGDIFDSPEAGESVPLLREEMSAWGIPVIITPGNHDYLTPGSPWLAEVWPDNVHIFTGGLASIVLPELDCRIYGAGYRAAESPALLDNFRAAGPEQYQIAVLHGDPMGPRSPYCPVTSAQVRDSGLSYLALGHIHKAGNFRASGTLCGWPGAPMGRGYDETGEKGVYLVELEDRTQLRFVNLDTPRFYDLEVDTDVQCPEAVLPPLDDGSFYRVTLTGTAGEPLEQMDARFAYLTNLKLIDRREKKADLWENVGEDTLEGTYFRLLREKLERAGEEDAGAIRLAAEISRKILVGREVAL